MLRLLLIANPSSSGFTGALHRDVVSTLGEQYEVTPIWPINPAATRQRAADASMEGYDIVVAMGGDGVVHHVANGLVGRPTPLGVIPAGTTNVVARIHGMPRDPRAAARTLLEAVPQPTTAAHLTSDSESGARSEYAIFAAGVGFDADVVEVAEQSPHSKLWFGSVHYARAAAGRVLGPYRRRPPTISAKVDGDRVEAVALFIQVHDVYTYFGRIPMRLGPPEETPPLAIAIESLDPMLAGRAAARLVTRRDVARLRGVHRWAGFESVTVTAEGIAPFQADGEHLGHAHSVQITPIQDALLVLRP